MQCFGRHQVFDQRGRYELGQAKTGDCKPGCQSLVVGKEGHERLNRRHVAYTSSCTDQSGRDVERRYGTYQRGNTEHDKAGDEDDGGHDCAELGILLDRRAERGCAHAEEEDNQCETDVGRKRRKAEPVTELSRELRPAVDGTYAGGQCYAGNCAIKPFTGHDTSCKVYTQFMTSKGAGANLR